MLPLFRKDKAKTPPKAPSSAPAESLPTSGLPASGLPASGLSKPSAGGGDGTGIHVQESGGLLPAELEEAAVLYANGKSGDAAAAIHRYLLAHPGLKEPEPWYMLFDLYEATNQRQSFEDSALDFAMKFERSPPAWNPRFQEDAPGPGGVVRYEFGQRFTIHDKTRLQHFLAEAKTARMVTLDFSKAGANDPTTLGIMLETVQRLVAMGTPVHVEGGQPFHVRLKASRVAHQLPEKGWLLELALLQLLGEEPAYEDLAVDFAIRFEISPPAYTPPKPLPADVVEVVGAMPRGHVFPIKGVVGPQAGGPLADLAAFAEKRPKVEVDLSRLARIDFAAIGLVLDTLIALRGRGCQVVLKDGNELVNALLRMVDADKFVTLQPRTRA